MVLLLYCGMVNLATGASRRALPEGQVAHRCTRGVGLTLLAFTTSTGDVTTCDLQLAARVEALVEAGEGSA